MAVDARARFWAKVDVRGEDDCWLWKQSVNIKSGYGQVGVGELRDVLRLGPNKRIGLPHRIAYQLAKGEIPADYEVDHLCKVRRCCNPKHLEAVTKHENCLRALFFSKENPRNRRGERNACGNGHEYPANPKRSPDGARRCAVCEDINHRNAMLRKAARAQQENRP